MKSSPVSLDDVHQSETEIDRLAYATQGADHFCSSSAWQLSAFEKLLDPRELIFSCDEHSAVCLARAQDERGRIHLQPWEAMWLFGSPLVTGHPERAVRHLWEVLGQGPWDFVWLSGLASDAPLVQALVSGAMARKARVALGPTTLRMRERLDDGAESFLRRRSANFRRGLKKTVRKVEQAGVAFVQVDVNPQNADEQFARVLRIDAQSWKGQQQSGLQEEHMRGFYHHMVRRLARHGCVRLLIAQQEGRDCGYVLGAHVGDTYRGLQFAFDDDFRPLGLGNAMQWAQIQSLAAERVVHYDLGMHAPYKERWSQPGFQTVTLVLENPA